MYMHIGSGKIIQKDEIIAVLDAKLKNYDVNISQHISGNCDVNSVIIASPKLALSSICKKSTNEPAKQLLIYKSPVSTTAIYKRFNNSLSEFEME